MQCAGPFRHDSHIRIPRFSGRPTWPLSNTAGFPLNSLLKWGAIAILVIVALSAAFGATYVVDPGRVGVVKRFGEIINVEGQGLHMKIPFVDEVAEISTALQTVSVDATAVSKDIQQVTTSVNVQYSIPLTAIKDTYTNYRGDIKALNAAVVTPGTETVTKMVTAGFTAEQLITQRAVVANQLKERLAAHLKANGGLVVAKVDITEFSFSEAFTKAIEDNAVAERSVLTEQKNQERKKVEAQQTVAVAEAEATSIRLRADAEAYAIQQQNKYATEMNVRMREAEAKIKTADAMAQWKVTVLGATPLIQTDEK